MQSALGGGAGSVNHFKNTRKALRIRPLRWPPKISLKTKPGRGVKNCFPGIGGSIIGLPLYTAPVCKALLWIDFN
jgi:hypothetical protein